MSVSSSVDHSCAICGELGAPLLKDESVLCASCSGQAEKLFETEMSRVELIRIIRGRDVELYDIKHPGSQVEKNHCGQLILIKAGQGFEVKICLRTDGVDWSERLRDPDSGFESNDTRLEALIGNVSLLMESWGGGPHYVDIFYVDRVISTEGEM